MKDIFKKNQVIVTALVIMVAVAGYLNFTDQKITDSFLEQDGTVETSAQLTEEENKKQENNQESGQVTETEKPAQDELTLEDEDTEDVADISDEDMLAVTESGELATNDDEENVGDAVLTTNPVSSDFFYSAKLSREQLRAKNKEMLMELVNNTNITETQKKDAVNSIIEMTSISEKENASETLLVAKGFENAIVSIVDGKADVMIGKSSITEQESAQIEDIVKRKTDISAENIVISTVGKQTE